MNKIEYAWVIQRDDGKYFSRIEIPNICVFDDLITNADRYDYEKTVKYLIEALRLQNCKPVKVEIRVVGEDDE